MLLQHSTWQEVERYLERSRGILIPIGSTEQHGPTGLIGTDAICPEVIAREVGERTGALVAPTVAIGMSQHHLGFPGSITLRPSTLIALVGDLVDSLACHGFERFYFLNGHGGNVATLEAAFAELHARASRGEQRLAALRFRLSNWYMAPAVKGLAEELFGEAEGSHATPSEVSLSYFAVPSAVKQAALDPPVAPRGPIRDAADFRRRFPDGRIGSNPALASIAHGERLWRTAVEAIERDYRAFLDSD